MSFPINIATSATPLTIIYYRSPTCNDTSSTLASTIPVGASFSDFRKIFEFVSILCTDNFDITKYTVKGDNLVLVGLLINTNLLTVSTFKKIVTTDSQIVPGSQVDTVSKLLSLLLQDDNIETSVFVNDSILLDLDTLKLTTALISWEL